MRDEVFNVQFNYKDKEYNVTVKADLPIGPEPFGSDYDIYIRGKHQYTINHCRNEDDVHCWEVKKKPEIHHDPEFAQAIGKAIDRYYGM